MAKQYYVDLLYSDPRRQEKSGSLGCVGEGLGELEEQSLEARGSRASATIQLLVATQYMNTYNCKLSVINTILKCIYLDYIYYIFSIYIYHINASTKGTFHNKQSFLRELP